MPEVNGAELAIDRKGRMRIAFTDIVARPVEERLGDFEETFLPLTPEEARLAAERCIHCPDPAPCYEACPAHNDIPSAMWLIEKGDFVGAAEIYRRTSSMPEICGRVCPHEAMCQGACVRNKRGEPVLTGALEAFYRLSAAKREGRDPSRTPKREEGCGRRLGPIGPGRRRTACPGWPRGYSLRGLAGPRRIARLWDTELQAVEESRL